MQLSVWVAVTYGNTFPNAVEAVQLAADWGGAIVWRVAMWYPEVIEKLIVMAGPHPQLFQKNLDADQKKKCGPRCCFT